jgi:hypothetical protein
MNSICLKPIASLTVHTTSAHSQVHQERQEHQHKQQQVCLQQQETAVAGTLTEARYVILLRVSHNGANTGKFTNISGKTKRQN